MKRPHASIRFILPISSLLCLLGHPLTPSIQADNTPINLWRIDRKGKGSIYLFGSVHKGDKAMIDSIPQVILDAFDKSKVLVIEADVKYPGFIKRNLWTILFSISIPLTPIGLYLLTKIPKEKKYLIWIFPCLIPLWVVLSMTFSYLYVVGIANTILQKDDFATIRRACRSLDMSWFETLTQTYIYFPSFAVIGGRNKVTQQLMQLPEDVVWPDPYFGIEIFLKRRIHEGESKVIEELETIEFQRKVLEGIRYKEKPLAEYARALPEAKEVCQEIRSSWEEGNMKRLEALFNQESDRAKEIEGMNELLTVRNYQMTDNIIQRYLQKSTESSSTNPLYDEDIFITVGVAHLTGEEGIIALLKNKGYVVHQLTRDGYIHVPQSG